ncbi:MAG TPA: alpha-glucan family phosphorylase [Gaiellaceae bacterium]|nr:alpha-glucan family phosphorylase [Gaiellaceae bacterium]
MRRLLPHVRILSTFAPPYPASRSGRPRRSGVVPCRGAFSDTGGGTLSTAESTTDRTTWWNRAHGGDSELLVAYFSMEFGVDAELAIYSGGLGVLAGDHLKAAADLGIPLVGVGLLYRGGYFKQGVDEAGRQTEDYQPVDPQALGLTREPVTVEVDLDGQPVAAAVWRKDVGSVPLYLLEVDWLTDALYGGDREHRIRQELLLGVGGVRALAALGIEPTVFHMNEGHSAFLALERIRALVEQGVAAAEAEEHVRRSTVFTTHTPVPAGNEIFASELVTRYVGSLAQSAGIDAARLLELGRFGDDGNFGLTPFALRLSAYANGVSELHGEVAREMWASLWPGEPPPIGHVTNGVHLGTWLDPAVADLLRSAGVRPEAHPDEASWSATRGVDPEALWRVHSECRARLAGRAGLDPERLTIGFARRFATYKRAGLVYSDLERLLALPVQIVVAGKAHPQDTPGKDVMQRIVELSRDPHVAGRVVFLENYDIALAQTIIPGCDVWLNTPRRPLEASGTSGMKAAVNGVLNLSVLDGWWAEAYSPEVGWAIDGASDEADAEQLYRLLEEQVVPTFANDRGRWVEMMKASIERLAPRFSMHRVLADYAERYYLPAHAGSRR